jgi:hypothetical protein
MSDTFWKMSKYKRALSRCARAGLDVMPKFNFPLSNFDGFVKSPKSPFITIPAPHHVRDKLQHASGLFKPLWIPAFAGMTRFLTF